MNFFPSRLFLFLSLPFTSFSLSMLPCNFPPSIPLRDCYLNGKKRRRGSAHVRGEAIYSASFSPSINLSCYLDQNSLITLHSLIILTSVIPLSQSHFICSHLPMVSTIHLHSKHLRFIPFHNAREGEQVIVSSWERREEALLLIVQLDNYDEKLGIEARVERSEDNQTNDIYM